MTTPVPTPKILNLSTPTIRNQRTLIWLKNQDTAVNWSKWDAAVTGLTDYHYWSQHNTKIVGIILNSPPADDTDTFLSDLFEASKRVPMLLLSQKVLDLKPMDYWEENFDNVLNLNNVIEQYPFIGTSWDGTDEDAVAILAMLCRYNRIIDCTVSESRIMSFSNNISIEQNRQPNQLWVITQFFKHDNSKRYREVRECLIKNCLCPHIDKIVLINAKDYSSEYSKFNGSNKIQQIVSGKRLTYSDFLQYVRDEVPENIFVVLSNADIYFGDSMLDLWKINMMDRMLALLRWDDDGSGTGKSHIFGPRADSQDTWIFLSNSIKQRTWDYSKFNFQLGQAGCDNAFAGQILRQRFLMSNPAMTFKTFHLHNSNIRNYNKTDSIKSDIYINLAPSYIIDTKQEYAPPNKASVSLTNDLVSFEVKSSSMSNEITYCTMLEKEGRYKWEPSVENYYFEAAIPLYTWKQAAVSPNGLVYDLYNIYKGFHAEDTRFNYWKNATVDILTPLQKRDQMLAIPFENTDVFKHPDVYILNYLSRCARLLQQYQNASFWIPKSFTEYLEYFNWGKETLNGVYFDENTACWADEVVGFLPSPAASELGSEDISALRGLLSNWVSNPCEKVCAIVVSGALDRKLIEERLVGFLQGLDENWTIRYVLESDYASYDTLLGASLCIFCGGQKTATNWSKLWALPVGCCVIEFQQELQISGEFQHLAHVAGFKSWVLLLSKGSVADVQEQIMDQLGRWFKKNGDEV